MRGMDLLKAARDGDLERVTRLLRVKDIDLNYSVKCNTPLTTALFNRHEQIALALIKAGADVNLQTKLSQSPLYLAAMRGMDEGIRELLQHGGKATLRDHMGDNALDCALMCSQYDIAKLLLRGDAELKDRHIDKAFLLAVESGQLDIVEVLVARGANLDYKLESDSRAIFYAIYNKHYDVVLYLIDAGADFNCKSFYGESFSGLASRIDDVVAKERIQLAMAKREGLLLAGRHQGGMLERTRMPLLEAVGAGVGAGAGAGADESSILSGSEI